MTIPALNSGSLDWVRTPFWRILGSFAGWFLFALAMTLLLNGFFSVLSVGGACASGPSGYEIAVECPDAAALMPVAVFVGLGSVAISVFFAQGFGTAITELAWPILFGSLGAGFIWAGGPVGWGVGGLFIVMALVPLVLVLRASPQRVFLGMFSVRGERFYEGENPRYSIIGMRYERSDETVPPNAGHWALSLIIFTVAVALGYYAALLIT